MFNAEPLANRKLLFQVIHGDVLRVFFVGRPNEYWSRRLQKDHSHLHQPPPAAPFQVLGLGMLALGPSLELQAD